RAEREAALLARLGADEAGPALVREAGPEFGLRGAIRRLLEGAGEEPRARLLVARVGLAWLGGFALFALLTADAGAAGFLGLGAAALPVLDLLRRRRRRRLRLETQLQGALEVMIISLRAGHALPRALRTAAVESEAPLTDELLRVAHEAELGRPLDEALLALGDRVPRAAALRTFITAVLVLRQTGGNLVEVLERVIDTLRAQTHYHRRLRALTAEGRASAFILAALPPVFVGATAFVDPQYIGRLLHPGLGHALLLASVGLYLAGLFWVRALTTPRS
ncbi:MAG: type II secretion system F family protein, partial [Myxococcales bacterium]|nr:type II secretion system F family protein [Myxococcales bacterium]